MNCQLIICGRNSLGNACLRRVLDCDKADEGEAAEGKITSYLLSRSSWKILTLLLGVCAEDNTTVRNLLNFRRNSVQNFVSHRFQKSGDWDTVQVRAAARSLEASVEQLLAEVEQASRGAPGPPARRACG